MSGRHGSNASPRHVLTAWLVVVVTASVTRGGRFGCPSRLMTRPCACQEKTKGLDISCENAHLEQLREALENIGQTGQVIWYLKLRNNQLSNFPSFLLDGLEVHHLTAIHSNVSSIDETAFEGLGDRMESLDLSQNTLEQVPTRAFSALTSLVSLNLNYNRIEILHAGAFRGLISLLRLSLFGNKIKFIDNLAFVGIGGNLTRINLGGNHLTAVPSQALRNLTVLQRLQLHENKIAAILREEFKGMGESLDVLNLATNMLEELPERAFSNLRALNSLDVESNYVQYIHPKAFEGIEGSLEWLKLGDNRLDEVPTAALQNLTKLRQLDLRGNNISHVNEDAFWNYGSNLKFIYLQKNNIRYIETGALDSLHSLEWFYLQSNQLTSASYETFSPILDTLQVLDIHDNPFTCDCGVRWFRDWVLEDGANIVSMPKETRCKSPEELQRLPILDIPSGYLVCSAAAVPPSNVYAFRFLPLVTTLLFTLLPCSS